MSDSPELPGKARDGIFPQEWDQNGADFVSASRSPAVRYFVQFELNVSFRERVRVFASDRARAYPPGRFIG
jgi:hypothetical protein